MESAIDAALPQPHQVARIMPRTSPIAQPVRQWVVAVNAARFSDCESCPWAPWLVVCSVTNHPWSDTPIWYMYCESRRALRSIEVVLALHERTLTRAGSATRRGNRRSSVDQQNRRGQVLE